jgi:hypothetical protein
MGQYYNPIILKDNWEQEKQPVRASLKGYDYGNGVKMMEHAYVGNHFVNAVMRMIDLYDKDRKGVIFAWVGDYADHKITDIYPVDESFDAGGHKTLGGGIDLYDAAQSFMGNSDDRNQEYKELQEKISSSDLYHYQYVINRTKGEYVKVPKDVKDKWVIHPLPILTADGDSRGGGDYHGNNGRANADLVGTWAYDRISVSNDPDDCKGLEYVDWYVEIEA